MKFEKRKRFSREEFAGLLADFARTITEENRIVFEDMEVSLPDYFEVELGYKEKHGDAKFEVELCWDISKAGGKHWGLISALRNITARSEASIPDNFKGIKKGMERKLADIANTISKGIKPADEDLNYFRELNRAFYQQSEPDWLNAMSELQTAVEGMINAAEHGNSPLAMEKIREINNIKKECHRAFK